MDVQQVRDLPLVTGETASDAPSRLVRTPLGLAMIEIQGELSIPHDIPLGYENSGLFQTFDIPENLSSEERSMPCVKIGRLDFEGDKVTMFVSTTQRLIGKIVKLDPPLGLLKLAADADGQQCQIVDIISAKIIFSSRPLPIM